MQEQIKRVRQFHEAFQLHIATQPTADLPEGTANLRARILQEELDEYRDAVPLRQQRLLSWPKRWHLHQLVDNRNRQSSLDGAGNCIRRPDCRGLVRVRLPLGPPAMFAKRYSRS